MSKIRFFRYLYRKMIEFRHLTYWHFFLTVFLEKLSVNLIIWYSMQHNIADQNIAFFLVKFRFNTLRFAETSNFAGEEEIARFL